MFYYFYVEMGWYWEHLDIYFDIYLYFICNINEVDQLQGKWKWVYNLQMDGFVGEAFRANCSHNN